MNRRLGPLFAVIGGALILGVGLVLLGADPIPDQSEAVAFWRGEDPDCPNDLTAADVNRGLELSVGWLLANQLPSGPFVDSRDWRANTVEETGDPVRQATALWALARVHQRAPTEETRASLIRGLGFWRSNSAGRDELRWAVWPGAEQGDTASEAILALATTSFLTDPTLEAAESVALRSWRDGLLSHLEEQANDKNRVRSRFAADGAVLPRQKASAEADSATLAALTAAALDDRADLAEPAKQLWRATWMHDVDHPRKRRRDPVATKETFPWLPLAIRDLAASGWLDTEDAGAHLMALSIWMIDDHQSLRRAGNTAYAQVGLGATATWALVEQEEPSAKVRCVADRGLARLLTWQPGHPRAGGLAATAPDAPHVSGGLPAAPSETSLRLDYAAHLTVALLEWKGRE